MTARPLVALLFLLGCVEKSDEDTSVAEETTLANSGGTDDDGSTDSGSTDSGSTDSGSTGDECPGKPDECCWPQQYLPGECYCAGPDEPCFLENGGCLLADGMVTCDDLCGQIGRACVAKGCEGLTVITGTGPNPAEDCPRTDNYGVGYSQACNVPIPIPEPNIVVSCCCTQ